MLILMCIWAYSYLGGVGLSPTRTRDQGMHLTGNDTSRIFNWHPILNTLAFAVFMAEALLAYRAPLAGSLDRPAQKFLHAVLHSCSLISLILAVTAAIKSHTLKRPTPTPNFYSAHSWLGLATICLAVIQYFVGFGAYLFPKLTTRQRADLSPIHIFLGRAVFGLGLTTMAVGIQEKSTFVQLGAKLNAKGLRQPIMTLPGAIVLLLAVLGILVLAHHSAADAPSGGLKPLESGELLEPVQQHSPSRV